jgi:hypothetical protein
LVWDQRQIEITPSPLDAKVAAVFGFVNIGEQVVTIETVRPSCGCTVTELAKRSYASSERGEIRACFDIGERRGRHEVTLSVTLAGGLPAIPLKLAVNIPEIARIIPPILRWNRGEPAIAKTMLVEALPGQPLAVVTVTTDQPEGFSTRLEAVRENGAYRISVSPQSTDRPQVSVLGVEVLLRDRTKVLPAYIQVLP